MKFDSGNDWDPGFDRSFAQNWETQPARGYPTLSPANLGHMKAAIKRYADMVARGGWDKLPLVDLRVGKTHPAVVALRQRLRAEGDLGGDGGYPEIFDSYVEKAVKVAQTRNALPPRGWWISRRYGAQCAGKRQTAPIADQSHPNRIAGRAEQGPLCRREYSRRADRSR